MMRKFATILAALAFGLTTFAPATASAQHYRGGHDRGYHGGGYYGDRDGCRRDHNYGCERDRDRRRYGRDDDGDALAAGVIGIVIGAVLANAIANSNDRRDDDRYYDRRDDDYYRGRGDYRDDPYYDEPPPPPECTRQERQWDRYANRYVTVDVPC